MVITSSSFAALAVDGRKAKRIEMTHIAITTAPDTHLDLFASTSGIPSTRRSRDERFPPEAAAVSRGTRTDATAASAVTYVARSRVTLRARSSQQFSRSMRICRETHQTAG